MPYTDYGARMYDSRIGRWFGVDLLAEKYYSMSPYMFCAGNPIKFVDPDGMDIYGMSSDGRVVATFQSSALTIFYYAVQIQGVWVNTGREVYLDNATMIKRNNPIAFETTTREDVKLTIFEVSNSEDAKKLFEFLVDVTNVEWGHVKIGTKSSLVGTVHKTDKTAIEGYALSTGYTIREANHNHPSGSGIASRSDVDYAIALQNKFPKALLHIYTTNPSTYTRFNKNTPKPKKP